MKLKNLVTPEDAFEWVREWIGDLKRDVRDELMTDLPDTSEFDRGFYYGKNAMLNEMLYEINENLNNGLEHLTIEDWSNYTDD